MTISSEPHPLTASSALFFPAISEDPLPAMLSDLPFPDHLIVAARDHSALKSRIYVIVLITLCASVPFHST